MSDHRVDTLTLFVVYSAEENLIDTLSFGDTDKKNSPKNLEWPVSPDTGIPVTHATLENQLEAGDEVEVYVIFDCSVSRVKCGILICEQNVSVLHSDEPSLMP